MIRSARPLAIAKLFAGPFVAVPALAGPREAESVDA